MRTIHASSALLLALVVASTSWNSTAFAASAADAREQHAAVAMGVTFGVLFHELAHAMIGELELAATGPEEDTADEFSALAMSQMAAGETDPTLINIATYSTLLWRYWALEKERTGQPQSLWGEHAPDDRRFRHTFCMLYGADPALFGHLANAVGVDQRFKDRCPEDYKKRERAWEAIIEPKARNLGPDLPGDHPANAAGGRIRLQVSPTQSHVGPFVNVLFGEPAMVEFLDMLSRYLVWPRDLLVSFQDCGQVNAYYAPDAGAVIMCYEIIEEATRTVLQGEGLAAVAPRDSAPAFFQGMWSTRLTTVYGLLDVNIAFGEDGIYRSDEVWVQTGGLAARVTGSWAAQSAADNLLLIHRRPAGWLPQEFCYYDQAACQAQGYESASYGRIIDQNTVEMDGAVWQRVR